MLRTKKFLSGAAGAALDSTFGEVIPSSDRIRERTGRNLGGDHRRPGIRQSCFYGNNRIIKSRRAKLSAFRA